AGRAIRAGRRPLPGGAAHPPRAPGGERGAPGAGQPGGSPGRGGAAERARDPRRAPQLAAQGAARLRGARSPSRGGLDAAPRRRAATRRERMRGAMASKRTRISAEDLYLFNEGTHHRLYDKLGAHAGVDEAGRPGTFFGVWAPNAETVSVIGDWNG